MNYDRSRAGRPLFSSAALQTTVVIAILALLVVCRPPQQAAGATAQMQTTRARQEEQVGEKRPSVIANQELAVERMWPARDEQPERMLASGSAQTQTCVPVLTLADLERMALQANPTLAQAEAAIRVAEGRREQAGLWPNPVVGYRGEEFATRAFTQKSEHFGFIEQTILLGGKLAKSQRIFAQEKVLAHQEAVAQRYRILNTVRMLFYEALGAQRRVETRAELARIAREAVGVTEKLFNVGQADRPDAFEIEIEAQRAQLDLIMAENRRDQVWQQLGAVLGDPFLKPACIAGDLERGFPLLEQETVLAMLLGGSPELNRAQAAVERARAAIA